MYCLTVCDVTSRRVMQEWTGLCVTQLNEEHELKKLHVTQQETLLKTLIEVAQAAQAKELEARQER